MTYLSSNLIKYKLLKKNSIIMYTNLWREIMNFSHLIGAQKKMISLVDGANEFEFVAHVMVPCFFTTWVR
jgi:hypothetical protein